MATIRIKRAFVAAFAVLVVSAAVPGATPAALIAGGVPGVATLTGPDSAVAQISKSRDSGGDSGGNVSRVGERTGSLISGWAVPVMLALAGIFILGALARREVGAAIAVVLITICASFFLLTPDSAESAIKGISQFILR
jgi:hypothetical protein